MKGLTIVKRTSKQEGTIRLRFRLRDGRGVDLYHKSDIDADLKDLDKFTDTGELKLDNSRQKCDCQQVASQLVVALAMLTS